MPTILAFKRRLPTAGLLMLGPHQKHVFGKHVLLLSVTLWAESGDVQCSSWSNNFLGDVTQMHLNNSHQAKHFASQ